MRTILGVCRRSINSLVLRSGEKGRREEVALGGSNTGKIGSFLLQSRSQLAKQAHMTLVGELVATPNIWLLPLGGQLPFPTWIFLGQEYYFWQSTNRLKTQEKAVVGAQWRGTKGFARVWEAPSLRRNKATTELCKITAMSVNYTCCTGTQTIHLLS